MKPVAGAFRAAALVILWDILEQAVNGDANDVINWMTCRGEEEGGFLWLTAQLQCRPGQLEGAIVELTHAPSRHRKTLQRRFQALLQKAT